MYFAYFFCSKCGKKVFDDSGVCPECGAVFVDSQDKVTAKTFGNCRTCGTAIVHAGAKFCPKCGAAVDSSQATDTESADTPTAQRIYPDKLRATDRTGANHFVYEPSKSSQGMVWYNIEMVLRYIAGFLLMVCGLFFPFLLLKAAQGSWMVALAIEESGWLLVICFIRFMAAGVWQTVIANGLRQRKGYAFVMLVIEWCETLLMCLLYQFWTFFLIFALLFGVEFIYFKNRLVV